MISMMQSLMVRLRPLVGFKTWDYCVLWKLSADQRFLDWMDCCCAGGGESSAQCGREDLFTCRDSMLQHPRTKCCDLLAQLPSSISLDSGIHGHTLISNQARWLNFYNSSDSSILEETLGTGLLVPVLGGLVELFVAKQVAEDEHVINFVKTQCNMILMGQEHITDSSNIHTIFSANVDGSDADEDQKDPANHFQSSISLGTAMESLNDLPLSSTNFLQQFNCTSGSSTKNDVFLEASHDSFLLEKTMMDAFKSSSAFEYQDMETMQKSMHIEELMEPQVNKGQLCDENKALISTKRKASQANSVSDCSDQIDDDDDDVDLKYPRKVGKAAQSKNIDAERRRRKKLNDRLYALRSLVPKISKLDRASILGDAIEFVKELQKQEKDLQAELNQENSEDKGGKGNAGIDNNLNDLQSDIGPKIEDEESQNQFHMRLSSAKQSHESNQIIDDKVQEMEPQVEVAQIERNEFFVKVFCEHKAGGFARLMEALSFLGLEVTNANVTSCKGLVSHVLKVEKLDSEMVKADYVRDSLLELTKNPSEKCANQMAYASEIGGGLDFHQHLHGHILSSHFTELDI